MSEVGMQELPQLILLLTKNISSLGSCSNPSLLPVNMTVFTFCGTGAMRNSKPNE